MTASPEMNPAAVTDRAARAASAFALGVFVGWTAGLTSACEEVPGAALGEVCAGQADCRAGLECVNALSSGGACLPHPASRAQPAGGCTTADQCRLAEEALWPRESFCREGACECPVDLYDCDDGFVFEPLLCLCAPITEDDEACVSGRTCRRGACRNGRCAACEADSDCAFGACEDGACRR